MSPVTRDRYGIPHLSADTVDGLAFAQGHNAACDRAWQLEVERRRSEGTLAEHLGPKALPADRFARRAMLDDTARRCFETLSPPTRRWVTSYVDGVNAGLAEGAARAPEFAATGTPVGRWRPWSPLGVFLARHVLFGTFPQKLFRAHVAATLGPAAVHLFRAEGPAGSGSNAWALAHGGPLIAGDPHRLIELPGVYQQVRLTCPEFDVVGFAFPGVPGLPHFGHAGPVAWAITNAMADYQDLYREDLRRADGRVLAREAGGFVEVAARTETVRVRGAQDVPVEVVETPRGPVVDHDRRTGEALSLRTPARVGADLGFDALLPLLRARGVDDVRAALAGWVEPVNSVLTADSTGRVLRFVAGRVPVREDTVRQLPVPAWEPRYAWESGWAELPVAEVTDVRVNANDRRPGDTAHLGVDFAAPQRAARIGTLLDRGADPAAVHMDTRLDWGVLRDLLSTVDADRPGLRDRLLAWDGQMRADSADAGLFAAWRSALARRLAEDPVLRPVCSEVGADPLFAPWTDPATRIGLCLDALVTGLPRLGGDPRAAATAALSDLAAGEPGRWGATHVLSPVRPPLDGADPALAALPPGLPVDGDGGCVLAASSLPGVSDVCARGPVARYVWDLGDRARSRWIVPFGASGVPGDPHFADQLPLWLAGGLVPVQSDDEA